MSECLVAQTNDFETVATQLLEIGGSNKIPSVNEMTLALNLDIWLFDRRSGFLFVFCLRKKEIVGINLTVLIKIFLRFLAGVMKPVVILIG